MKIGKNIARFRREKDATQEQLADFTGVSAAAVSKWETESSCPDIALLPSIAEYLGVSIDVLMDFSLSEAGLDMLRDHGNQYIMSGDFAAAIPLYEKAVKKHPNDFELNYFLGDFLAKKALSSQETDRGTALEAVSRLEKALILHKGGESFSNSIRQQISFVYGALGEYGRAIATLEKADGGTGEYSVQIAGYMIKQGRHDEAKLTLQQVLFRTAFDFAQLTDRLGKCFLHEGDEKNALEILELNAHFREFFANGETPNYFDDLSSKDFFNLAEGYRDAGREEKMWAALDRAADHAVRFDSAPSYQISDAHFMNGYRGYITTSASQQACGDLMEGLLKSFRDYAGDERYERHIKILKDARRDKAGSGIGEE